MKKILPTIVAILVMLACIRLALWQLERAEYKAALVSAQENAPALVLADVDIATPRFSRVSGDGYFDHRRQVLLDNQVHNTRPGVHVFTPFRRQSDGRIFMVNRGWLPFSDGRRALPEDWPTPDGLTEITGVLNDPPRVGWQLGTVPPLDPQQWPNLMTYYDSERLAETFGPELDGRVIQLDPSHPAGFAGRDWQAAVFGPERHRAYAFQWFLIAAAVFTIWLVLLIKSLRNR